VQTKIEVIGKWYTLFQGDQFTVMYIYYSLLCDRKALKCCF